jgi:glycosyltransferase involved in cell wall biosynthesis
MSSEPEVSVVMATFNRPQYLDAAIDSVLSQSIRNLELIIADDGSDEPARRLLQSRASDARVRLTWLAHTGRPAKVRNAALALARAPYVAFQDSDDVWRPDKLALQLDAIRAAPAARWSYTACEHIDALGREFRPPGVAAWQAHRGRILDAVACLRAHSALPTILVERSLLAESGGFDENLALFEDHDLWLRFAARAGVAVVTQPLVQVRRHETHYSGHDALATVECRAIFLDRAWRCELGSRARAELRRLRALNAARLARLRASAGDRRAARRSLLMSAGTGWRYFRWWLEAGHTLAIPPPALGNTKADES